MHEPTFQWFFHSDFFSLGNIPSMLIRVELNLSHWPLVCRWYGLVHIFCIPISLQRSATNWLSMFQPWSIRIFWATHSGQWTCPIGFWQSFEQFGSWLHMPEHTWWNGLWPPEHSHPGPLQVPGTDSQCGLAPEDVWPQCFWGGLWMPGFEGKTWVTLPGVLFSLGSHARPEEPITHEVKHALQAQMTNLIMASSESNLPLCSWQNQLKEGLLWFSGLGSSIWTPFLSSKLLCSHQYWLTLGGLLFGTGLSLAFHLSV